eukprot:scaffold1376_cov125-Cylindrotheca_fusiformis.AAC.8
MGVGQHEGASPPLLPIQIQSSRRNFRGNYIGETAMKLLLLLFCQVVCASSHKSPSTAAAGRTGLKPRTAFERQFLFHNPRLPSFFQIASSELRGGSSSISDSDMVEEEQSEMRRCPCVLCGQEIIATSQADCEAHMAVCPAFARVHQENGETNPQGVYPPKESANEENTKEPKDIDSMSVKELRKLILESGLTDTDCIEKADLRARAREALNLK